MGAKEREERKQREAEEEQKRKEEEASYCQHVPSLRWIPQKSRKEQTKQTPNRARKEEEDPRRAQKAPQHRPSGNRKLREKVTEFWTDLYALEEEKYDQE